MKRKWLVTMLLTAAMWLFVGVALAVTDPIVCTMEISPEKLSGPGTVNVTINISNSGNTDMKDPVVLYNPIGQVVSDFGTDGSVLLKAGESKTWKGTWDVNQRTLENGSILFYVKYTLYSDSGKSEAQSQPIRSKISYQTGDADIDIKRTISPGAARNGQTVTVKYDIVNTGAVSLLDVTIQENKDINKEPQTIAELKPGETAQIKFPVTMGKKDLTSSATISYRTSESKKVITQEIEAATIVYGEPAMTAKLTSSAKGVAMNDKVTLTLELTNNGNVDYSNLRVSDPTLGDVFTNQSLAKGGTLKLEKEITLTATTEYQFTITAIDNTGTEVSLSTDSLTLTAVDPNEVLHLAVEVTPDRTEVYEQPGKVRFSVAVTNDSDVDAKDVAIMHGTTKIYTFTSIPAGETRRLTRDAALSMAGRYQFVATTKDALDKTVSFGSNEVQIAFSVPTPAPATATPPPVPTAEPTFSPVTVPPIRDSSIGTVPKMIQNVLLPILIISGLLLIASGVLLIIATKRRADQKKTSEAAYDHLERSKRRDYVTPSAAEDEMESKLSPKASQRDTSGEASNAGVKRSSETRKGEKDIPLDDVELPHLKYVRNAFERKGDQKQPEPYRGKSSSLFDDEDLYGNETDVFAKHNQDGVMYEESYDVPYDDAAYDEGYGDDVGDDRHDDGTYDNDYANEYDDRYEDSGEYDDQEESSADGQHTRNRVADSYDSETRDSYDDINPKTYHNDDISYQRTGRSKGEAQGSDLGY